MKIEGIVVNWMKSSANVTRSEDWVALAATGQGMDSQLLKAGASTDGEENGEDSVSYFGILFRA